MEIQPVVIQYDLNEIDGGLEKLTDQATRCDAFKEPIGTSSLKPQYEPNISYKSENNETRWKKFRSTKVSNKSMKERIGVFKRVYEKKAKIRPCSATATPLRFPGALVKSNDFMNHSENRPIAMEHIQHPSSKRG